MAASFLLQLRGLWGGGQKKVYVLRHTCSCCPYPGVYSFPFLFLLAFHRSAFLTRHHFGDLECEASSFVPLSGPSGEKAVLVEPRR